MADIVHSIQISAKPEAVYPLVAAGAGFAAWWAADVTDQDGSVTLGFFDRKTVYQLKAASLEPPQRAEWLCETGAEWSGTRLLFVLVPQPGGTLLRFRHAGWRSETDYFVACNTTWGTLMFRLKAAAEGKSSGPLFTKDGMGY